MSLYNDVTIVVIVLRQAGGSMQTRDFISDVTKLSQTVYEQRDVGTIERTLVDTVERLRDRGDIQCDDDWATFKGQKKTVTLK